MTLLSFRVILGGLLTVALALALLAIPTGSVPITHSGISAQNGTISKASPAFLSASSSVSSPQIDPVGVAGFQLQPQPAKASEINTTQSAPFDAANTPYKFYKDPGNSLRLSATGKSSCSLGHGDQSSGKRFAD
jgi:hypothetical protein